MLFSGQNSRCVACGGGRGVDLCLRALMCLSLCHCLDLLHSSHLHANWAAPYGKPLLLSAFACKLIRPRSTCAQIPFRSLQYYQACAAAYVSLMLWVLVQVWPLHRACIHEQAVSCGQALDLLPGPRWPACSREDAVNWYWL